MARPNPRPSPYDLTIFLYELHGKRAVSSSEDYSRLEKNPENRVEVFAFTPDIDPVCRHKNIDQWAL